MCVGKSHTGSTEGNEEEEMDSRVGVMLCNAK